MTLTTPPTAPARTQSQTTFRTNMDAFLTWIVTFVAEMNALVTTILGYKTSAETAATTATNASAAAVGAANYKGEWSTLSGVLAIPAAVSHDDNLYYLKSTLADVTTKTPGVATEWALISTGYDGGTYTGAVTYQQSVTYGDVSIFTGLATYNGAAVYNGTISYAGIATYAAGARETIETITGTTPAISMAGGAIKKWTLSGNSTPNFSGMSNGDSVILRIDDGAGYTLTLTGTWMTADGSTRSLLTSGWSELMVKKIDGALEFHPIRMDY